MAQSNRQKLETLMEEIDNLINILVKVDEGSEPMDTLTEQKQKVFDLLSVISFNKDEGYIIYPMHKLLSCKPLTQTEIPLDVLEQLTESDFDVNSRCYDFYGTAISKPTCLALAVQNEHYNAVRCLVKHAAVCDIDSIAHKEYVIVFGENYFVKTPLAELASKANAPLDLFNLLATPRSLNGEENSTPPLWIAINERHTENALHLIKLGSPLKSKGIPLIQCYLEAYSTNYHDELFTCLIPSTTQEVLQCINLVLQDDVEEKHYREEENKEADIQTQVKLKMLHRLFQYIPSADEMCLSFENYIYTYSNHVSMMMNGLIFTKAFTSLQPIYWWGLMLVNLGWRFVPTPTPPVPRNRKDKDFKLDRQISDTWNTYRRTVLSLQNMCIQQTRRSMRDFSDDSFMGLPVPNKLRRLLMYQHVAEIAYEARGRFK